MLVANALWPRGDRVDPNSVVAVQNDTARSSVMPDASAGTSILTSIDWFFLVLSLIMIIWIVVSKFELWNNKKFQERKKKFQGLFSGEGPKTEQNGQGRKGEGEQQKEHTKSEISNPVPDTVKAPVTEPNKQGRGAAERA
jgi:hypothetical protein